MCFDLILASDPQLLHLQLVLVELVAEEAVLLLKIIDGTALLDCHLDAALDLELQKIYRLLSVTQLQLQCLLFYLQGLALTLSLF